MQTQIKKMPVLIEHEYTYIKQRRFSQSRYEWFG